MLATVNRRLAALHAYCTQAREEGLLVGVTLEEAAMLHGHASLEGTSLYITPGQADLELAVGLLGGRASHSHQEGDTPTKVHWRPGLPAR
jgi:hypothetical protein